MTNVKWHADQLNKISSSMKRPRGASEFGGSDDGLQNDVLKRSRPNHLLRKLRNAQRHRQAQIARPQGSSGNVRILPVDGQPDAEAAPWPRRGMLLILVPLSIVGMVALFVMGFVGGREMVSYLVGPDSAPTTLTAGDPDGTQPVERVAEEQPAASDQTANQTAQNIIPPAGADVTPEPLEPEATPTPAPEAVSEPETASVFDGYVPPAQDAEAPAELDTSTLAEPDAAAEENVADSPVVITEEPASTQTAALIPEPAAATESAANETNVLTAPEQSETGSVFGRSTQDDDVEDPGTGRDHDDLSDELSQRRQAVAAVDTSAPTAEPVVVDDTDEARLIGQGHDLMAAGNVIEARELFTRALSSGSAEAALALGRSFDPKHLAGIRETNAKPDSLAARRWYEEWYRRSVEQGLISPNVRLERLLQAMNAG